MATLIHQEVDFKASPKRVYEALIDAKQFSTFSCLPKLRGKPVVVFKCFDGKLRSNDRISSGPENRPDMACRYVAQWRQFGRQI